MSADDGPIARREVAWRLFAAEFEDADFEHSEEEGDRAPNYVITPTGARVNRLFVVGVLTEVEQVGEDILRGRVVDPTGAFVVYAGQYQPDAKAFLQGVNPPTFVAVTGKARTFQPDDSDVVYTSVRPESINEVDAATRDRWTVQTAEHTLHRVSVFDDALALDEVGDALEEALLARGVDEGLASGIPLAIDHYGTTRSYLAEMHDLAVDATRVVAGEIDATEVGPVSLDPDEGGPSVDVDLSYEPAGTELEAPAEPATEPAGGTASEPPRDAGVETGVETEVDVEAQAGIEAEAETESSTDDEPTVDDPVDAADVGVPTDEEPDVEPGEDAVTDEEFEPEVETEADLGTAEASSEMYELDEEERAEIEENYPTDFATGSEIDAGEADLEPTGDAAAEPATEPTETASAEDEVAEDEAAEVEADEDEGLDEITEEVEAAEATEEPPEDLDEALMEVMRELNEGDGVHRDDLEAAMADRYGVDSNAVGEAIDDALMGGECYEPADDTYVPI